ncbi:hypothetical protein [Salinactinospora qingdaonensis]|uniref:AAA domain-containing protein n=1 Tax=Salinactinospora qingdaonensis TaxID=702744 RepID=A0ABP7FDH7_9ACTN
MRDMRLLELVIHGPLGPRPYYLDHRIVSVSGPVNTGKTSMADAIGFVLGQKVNWKLAFKRYVSHVELRLRLQDNEVWLRRHVRNPKYVEVLDLGRELVERLPVKAPSRQEAADEATLSDRLLGWLDLKETIAPDEVRAVNRRAARLGFLDVWPYLYRTQREIDRQVILHQDRNSARKHVFELLFGLTDPRAQILQARLKECEKSLREQSATHQTLQRFFEKSTTTPEQAVAEHQTACQEKEALQEQLRRVREQARAVSRSADPLRREVDQARQSQTEAAAQRHAADTRVDQAYEAVRSLKRSLAEHDPVFTSCPACAAALAGRTVPAGHCALCLQPQTSNNGETQRDRLQALHDQAVDKLAQAEQEAGLAAQTHREATTRATEAEDKLQAYQTQELAPLQETIEELVARNAATKERITTLQTQQEHYERLQEIEAGIRATQEEITDLKEKLKKLDDQLSSRRRSLNDMDERFQEVIDVLQLPWYNGNASLDHSNYLPLIDQQTFTDLGGGTQAAVNVAYSFALLQHALLSRTTNLPGLLIIDSISKNIGANPKDRALADRIYEYALKTAAAWESTPFSGSRDCQLIILDNDRPKPKLRDQIHEIPLSYDAPLIPGVSHDDTGEAITSE